MSFAWIALVTGLIVGFYWGRVIKLVLKARRLTGKAANLVPPELLGKILRIVWYPTVVTWIVAPLVVWLSWVVGVSLPGSLFAPMFVSLPVQLVGLAVSFVALYLTMICWRKMGKSWRMGIDPNEKTSLIVEGPYARVRHPIYALQVLLVIATFVAVPVPVMLGVVILLTSFLTWESLREEHYLLKAHGEPYANYIRQVPRFVPSMLGRKYAG
jgi:protein-S-isoprenylcysteine O-methyltransferase Ste14